MLPYFLSLFLLITATENDLFSLPPLDRKPPEKIEILAETLNTPLEEINQGIINPYKNLEEFIAYARDSIEYLPPALLEKIECLKQHKTEDGYLLLRHLPRDENLPMTPEESYELASLKSSFVSEYILSLFATTLGEPFNYIQEEQGNIFRNIKPTHKNASEQTSDSSKVDLELHTETAFHWFKPDYLMLYCLRGDRSKKAYTLVSSLKKVIPELDEETLQELRKVQYSIGIDVSFGNKDKTKFCEELIPILYGEESDPMITYDVDLIRGPTEESTKALQRLREAIIKVQEAVLLEPGDLLIVDNKRAIHGRTSYSPYFDGYDRWLQRVLVSTNPTFAAHIKDEGRIITYQY